MPISMFDRSANGTSLVTSSHSRIAKLHMSADRRLISSGFFCRATGHKNQPVWAKSTDSGAQGGPLPPPVTMQPFDPPVTVVPWLFSCSLIELCFQFYCYTRGSHQQIMSVSATVWTCVHPSPSGSSCHSGSVLRDGCLPSGATHAGEYILPGHWKENLTSAMLILAVMSSSICEHKQRCCSAVLCWATCGCYELFRFSPSHSCCWDSDEGSLVQACVKRPFHSQCPGQTSPPASGPRRSLTGGRETKVNPLRQNFNSAAKTTRCPLYSLVPSCRTL